MIKHKNYLHSIDDIKIGNVIKVSYIVKKKKKRRMYEFIGLCIYKKKDKFVLFNKLKKEKVRFVFQWGSPAIFQISNVYAYKPFMFRSTSLYFKLNLALKSDPYSFTTINSSLKSYKFGFSNIFSKQIVGSKRVKKIKSKYRYRNLVDYKESRRSVVNRKKLNNNLIDESDNDEEFENNDHFVTNDDESGDESDDESDDESGDESDDDYDDFGDNIYLYYKVKSDFEWNLKKMDESIKKRKLFYDKFTEKEKIDLQKIRHESFTKILEIIKRKKIDFPSNPSLRLDYYSYLLYNIRHKKTDILTFYEFVHEKSAETDSAAHYLLNLRLLTKKYFTEDQLKKINEKPKNIKKKENTFFKLLQNDILYSSKNKNLLSNNSEQFDFKGENIVYSDNLFFNNFDYWDDEDIKNPNDL